MPMTTKTPKHILEGVEDSFLGFSSHAFKATDARLNTARKTSTPRPGAERIRSSRAALRS
jgi:hypothetical protein